MAKLQFTCTLLSDVILNQNSGTKTEQTTLDFIPGNSFLGIAASSLYLKLSPEESLILFHSGKVRFGDAHPVCGGSRSLRIPAVLYYKKGGELNDGAFVLYKWNAEPGVQPKQCRSGFYVFADDKASKIKTSKSVAIKSAYDREMRRSKDEAMYSYESLRKGLKFAFEVDFDDDVQGLQKSVRESLVGNKHIGHSKTAQYGLVRIESNDWTEPESSVSFDSDENGKDLALVYADGRLIFLDETGVPVFSPRAKDLGFQDGAEVDWTKSQIRTFQYAPWNSKRQNPDTDRCGIEKGSVIVVKLNGTQSPAVSGYVGDYKTEGFGKVIYNPSFLNTDANGYSSLMFEEATPVQEAVPAAGSASMNNLLIRYMEKRKQGGGENRAYEIANKYVRENAKDFRNSEERFASQWGYIRTLADSADNLKTFRESLEKYLSHGVAEEKWTYKKKTLLDFVDEKVIKANSGIWREIMVNLASEMAKQCKQ